MQAPTSKKCWLPEVASLALLAIMPLVLFRQAIGSSLVAAPYDVVLYGYPYRAAAAAALHRGQFPFWNPDIYAGAPFFANIQSAVLYPVNWLFSLSAGPQMLAFSIMVNLAIGAVLYYAFGRRALGLSPAPALVGGLAFGFSGFVVAQSEHLNQNGALPWMPGVILALDQAYRKRSPAWAGVLAVCLGLQFLAGAPQEVYDTLVLGLLWIAMLLWRHRGAGLLPGLVRLLWPSAGMLTALLLVSVQLLPTAELARYSVRFGGLPIDQAASFSLPLQTVLVNLLSDYGTLLYNEYAGYVGLIATLLAALAVVRLRRAPQAVLLSVVSAVAFLLALGLATPLFQLAYHFLPGFSSFRVPARWLMVWTFGVAALAGLGAGELDTLLQTRRDWRWTAPLMIGPELLVLFIVAFAVQKLGLSSGVLKAFSASIQLRQLLIWLALLLVGGLILLTARWRGAAASPFLALLLAIELFLAAQPLAPLQMLPTSIYAPNRLLTAVGADSGPYRSLSLAGSRLIGLASTGYGPLATRREVDEPNIGMETGRASIDGYDGGLLPLGTYERFRSLLLPAGSPNPPTDPLLLVTADLPPRALLNLLNVRYLLVTDGQVASAPPSDYHLVARQDGFSLLENRGVLPRAFVVHRVTTVGSPNAALNLVGAANFVPDNFAVAEEPGCDVSTAGGTDRVDVLKNQHEHLRFRAASANAGLLVITNANYPGWHATVDGSAAAISNVDALVQGVCLPAGTHTIALDFQPSNWLLGVVLSLIGLLALCGLLLAEPLLRATRSR